MTDLTILLYSPMDLGILGASLQTLFVTCPYMELEVRIGARPDECIDDIKKMTSSIENLHIIEDCKSLSDFVDKGMTFTDRQSEFTVLCPPGTIFLSEGWWVVQENRFKKNAETLFATSHWQEIELDESKRSFPSVNGVLAYRTHFLLLMVRKIHSIPSIGLGALSYKEAISRNGLIGEIDPKLFSIYKSALGPIPIYDSNSEWMEVLKKIEGD